MCIFEGRDQVMTFAITFDDNLTFFTTGIALASLTADVISFLDGGDRL